MEQHVSLGEARFLHCTLAVPRETDYRDGRFSLPETTTMKQLLACAALLLVTLSASAKVTQQEADRLKPAGDLTPMGAEKAASKDGTIPKWEGGLTKSPACYKGTGSRYC